MSSTYKITLQIEKMTDVVSNAVAEPLIEPPVDVQPSIQSDGNTTADSSSKKNTRKGAVNNNLSYQRNNRNYYNNGGGQFHSNHNYHYQMHGMYGNHAAYEIDPQMREYYNHMAVQQIELLFSIDCLCMDTYFRSFMDEAGYSPLFFVASYPNVAYYGATLIDIMTKISAKEDSPLEVDQENETIRLKEGWEKWLMPNDTGGMGVPRYYLKEQYIQSTQSMQEMTINPSHNNIFRPNQNRTQRGGTGMKMRPNDVIVAGSSCMSTSPTTVQMTEESSSCRDSTSGESRDSDDAMTLQTPEGSVMGGDHPFDSLEGTTFNESDGKITKRQQQQQQEQRRDEEDREQQKQHADRLCPAPVTVVASPTSVTGLGWAGILKKNLDAVSDAGVPVVKTVATNVKLSKQSKQSPASAPSLQRKQVNAKTASVVPSDTTAVTAATPTENTEPAVKAVVSPVAGKFSYAAILAAAAAAPSTTNTTTK